MIWLKILILGLCATMSLTKRQEVEEVTKRQLDTLIKSEDYLAVFWYGKNCKTCDRILAVLETKTVELDDAGIKVVRINDKKSAKSFGILSSPGLTYFKGGKGDNFEGELTDGEQLMDYLASPEAMELPDQIEEVNAKQLDTLVQEKMFVAVLFYNKQEESSAALAELENIDSQADKVGIAFVKINDLELVSEFGLGNLPKLVYYRHTTPIVYDGDVTDEAKVLDWLINNRGTGDDSERLEEVTSQNLEAMTSTSEGMVVLFYDTDSRKAENLLEVMEQIDDDVAKHGIQFVKCSEEGAAEQYGVARLPSLVFFKNDLPSLYEGNLFDDTKALEWILNQEENASIEELTSPMIEKLIREAKNVVVVFYRKQAEESQTSIADLEQIDDDLSTRGVHMVKTCDMEIAEEYGIEKFPSIVYFENGIPYLYPEMDSSSSNILKWILKQVDGDEIEEVTDEMLDKLVNGELDGKGSIFSQHKDVGVLFFDKDEPKSEKVLASLETIDDDCDRNGIILVKLDNPQEAQQYGIDEIPSLVYFEDTIPHLFEGNLENENEVLGWLLHQMKHEEIESVNDEMLEMLIAEHKFVSALFYDDMERMSTRILTELENIDDEAENKDIFMVKLDIDPDNKDILTKFGIPDKLPQLALFEDNQPLQLFQGNLENEEEALDWLIKATINDVAPEVKALKKPEVAPPKKESKEPKKEPPKEKGAKETPASKESTKAKPPPAKETPVSKESTKAKPTPKPADAEPVALNLKKPDPNENLAKSRSAVKDPKPSVDEPLEDDEVNSEATEAIKTLNEERNVVAFFYERLDKVATKIISGLTKVEEHFVGQDIVFINIDVNDVKDISVTSVPSLVYFKNGEPEVYNDNLMNEEVMTAFIQENFKANLDVIEDLSFAQIKQMVQDRDYVLIYVYDDHCPICDEALQNLEDIDDDADAVGVRMVKTDDTAFSEFIGLSQFPSIVYYEHSNPHIYDGDPREESELLTWILYQMKEDTVENINRDLLMKMIGDYEYLAVFFYNDNEDSQKMLRHLELIDDEAAEYEVKIVKIDDPLMAKKYGHRDPPGLGFFRKGNYVKYEGDEFDEEEMLEWLTDPNVMAVSDQIEKVNRKMFEKLKSRNDNLAVFFFAEKDCKQCPPVLQELENIDDEAEAADIPIVKLEDKILAKEVGVFSLPAVVFFRVNADPTIYAGDLKNEDAILEWMLVQKDPANEAIAEQSGENLKTFIENTEAVAIYLYSHENCETCLDVLQGLENIDDDAQRQNIALVKTTDAEFAESIGIDEFPALVFYKDAMPNVFDGDITAEEEVLDWLIEVNVESHIELITRPMLEEMVEEIQYLGVHFFKHNCRTCDQVLAELENIDDECDDYGIQLVKLNDPQLAKRYGIKTFPSLVYFRNGNPLTFDGDLKNEASVLSWLVSSDNRELDDAIEHVNMKMLKKLLPSTPLMAVFFYDEECIECEVILESLENIDDEADLYGIDFVKNDDPATAKHFHIYNTPALVYFRRQDAVTFEGDLTNDEAILNWLTSQEVFSIGDEIEEVNRKMLEKLLEENDFVAVYFYSDDSKNNKDILEGLEKIDQETDNLDITFIKINDPRYARKYGVTKLPALVYFRKKFPSIYRDDLLDEFTILDWLKRNRYKRIELDWIMYSVMSVALAFLLYSAFLVFGLPPKDIPKKSDDD